MNRRRARAAYLSLAIALLPGIARAQDLQLLVGGGKSAPIDIPVWCGALVDLTGYGLFAAPLLSEDVDTRLTLSSIGALTMAVGGIGWNLALDAKTRHWESELGVSVSSSDRAKCWNLSLWAAGCEVGSAIVGFANDADPGPAGYISSLLLGLAGGVIELINIQGPRLHWMIDMSVAYKYRKDASYAPPRLAPIIASIPGSGSKGSSLFLGFDASLM